MDHREPDSQFDRRLRNSCTPNTHDISIEQLNGFLSVSIYRRQRKWSYLSAFAHAFGLPEQDCFALDLRDCATIKSLQWHYGSNPQRVVTRPEARAKAQNCWQASDPHAVWLLYHERGHHLYRAAARQSELEFFNRHSNLLGEEDAE